MPDMQQQIDSLREAFSADTTKPFELKPTFPYGSPGGPAQYSPSQVSVSQYRQPDLIRAPMDVTNLEASNAQASQVSYTSYPITPPISATASDSQGESPDIQSMILMSGGQQVQQQSMATTMPMVDHVQHWNPSRIFE